MKFGKLSHREAYYRGQQAAIEGLGKDFNPYSVDSELYDYWLAGYEAYTEIMEEVLENE